MAEGCGPRFGVSSKKESNTIRAVVETKSANKYIRTPTENQKENSRSVSALSLSLSLHGMFLFAQLK